RIRLPADTGVVQAVAHGFEVKTWEYIQDVTAGIHDLHRRARASIRARRRLIRRIHRIFGLRDDVPGLRRHSNNVVREALRMHGAEHVGGESEVLCQRSVVWNVLLLVLGIAKHVAVDATLEPDFIDGVETIHLAVVHSIERVTPRMANIAWQGVRHSSQIYLLPGRHHTLRSAICARKCSEHAVKAAVLFDDENDVLNYVYIRSSGIASGICLRILHDEVGRPSAIGGHEQNTLFPAFGGGNNRYSRTQYRLGLLRTLSLHSCGEGQDDGQGKCRQSTEQHFHTSMQNELDESALSSWRSIRSLYAVARACPVV